MCLDGITDPQNLGAIIRSAEQFGADCVVIPKRRNAGITDTVARVSSGAVEYIPVFSVQNMSRTVDYLKKNGFWVFGADAGGVSVLDSDFRGRVAVILGSEGSGVSRLVKEHCDALISHTHDRTYRFPQCLRGRGNTHVRDQETAELPIIRSARWTALRIPCFPIPMVATGTPFGS